MNVRSAFNPYDDGDDVSDPNHRDRTLRALEGRAPDDDYLQMTPPDSAEPAPDAENTADIFMRIAREDSTRRVADDARPAEEQIGTVSHWHQVGETQYYSLYPKDIGSLHHGFVRGDADKQRGTFLSLPSFCPDFGVSHLCRANSSDLR